MAFYWITLGFLLFCSLEDLKKRKINGLISAVYSLIMTAAHFILGDMEMLNLLAGVGLGGVLLSLSWVTREAVGYGDGVVIMACGASLGLIASLQILLIGLLLAAVWSGILLVRRRAGRKDSFPFVPFLMLAELCVMIMARTG